MAVRIRERSVSAFIDFLSELAKAPNERHLRVTQVVIEGSVVCRFKKAAQSRLDCGKGFFGFRAMSNVEEAFHESEIVNFILVEPGKAPEPAIELFLNEIRAFFSAGKNVAWPFPTRGVSESSGGSEFLHAIDVNQRRWNWIVAWNRIHLCQK